MKKQMSFIGYTVIEYEPILDRKALLRSHFKF